MNGGSLGIAPWISRMGRIACFTAASAAFAGSAQASDRVHGAAAEGSRIVLAALVDPAPRAGAQFSDRLPLSKARKTMHPRQAASGQFAIGSVYGAAGAPIPIAVALPKMPSTDLTLLTIRGLPKTFSLSSGFRFEDSWAVSLTDVEGLAIMAPPNYTGRFTLEVQLINGQQQAPEKLTVPVEIRPRSDAIEAVASVRSGLGFGGAAPLPRAAGFPSQIPSKISPKEEASMMDRGGRLLKTGDIAAARMLFERLARRGSAQGAYAAGRTYDPDVLKSMKVVGLAPNPMKARDWYVRAADLGQPEAVKRLGRK